MEWTKSEKDAFVSKYLTWTAVIQCAVYLSSTLEFENSSMHSKQLLFILAGHDQFSLFSHFIGLKSEVHELFKHRINSSAGIETAEAAHSYTTKPTYNMCRAITLMLIQKKRKSYMNWNLTCSLKHSSMVIKHVKTCTFKRKEINSVPWKTIQNF